MTTIAILGAGKIGEAMLAGLLGAGRPADSLLFTERYPARVAELTERYGVRGVETDEAAKLADVLIVAVKPQDIEPMLVALAGSITPGTLVVSLCAGLPTSLYERHLPDGTAGRPGDAEHADAGRRGDERDLRRVARHRGAPAAGAGSAVHGRQGRPGAGKPAGRGDGAVRVWSGLLLLSWSRR